VNKSLEDGAAEDSRKTPDYAYAMQLLSEKKELQARLRKVDRMLRELEILTTGVISLARDDLDRTSQEHSASVS